MLSRLKHIYATKARAAWPCSIMLLLAAALTTTAVAQQRVEFWHYWGSGGDRVAVNALINEIQNQVPGLQIEDRFIAGAAAEMRRQLSTAFMAGRPPGVYQSSLGYDLKVFADAGRLRPIDDVWARINGNAIFPEGLRRVVTINGHPYAIPLNMHVTNHIFYNVRVFEEHGLTPPTNWEEFDEIARTLRESGIEPLANAGGPWTQYHIYLFLAEVLGVDGFFALSRGEIPFDSPEVREAYERYRARYIYNYMSDWSGFDWVGAGDRFIKGEVAMYQTGDWIVGLFLQRGLEPMVDFNFFPAPGTENLAFIQVDVLAAPVGAPNLQAVDDFLAAAASAEAQAAFNAPKGSVAANLDTNKDIYGPIMARTYERLQLADAVIPNLRWMLPARLSSEFVNQTVRFALSPDDNTLTEVLTILEGLRLEAILENAFVAW